MKKTIGQIKNTEKPTEPLFYTWSNDTERHNIMKQASVAFSRAEPIVRSTAAMFPYQNIAPSNVSIREGFHRTDYEQTRPLESIPQKAHDAQRVCMDMYDNVGLIKNVIDMMADFASQGIDIVHRSPSIEKLHKAWKKKISMQERTERFLNYFYRIGTVIPRRRLAKISAEDLKNMLDDVETGDLTKEQKDFGPSNIPVDYTFLNPLAIDVANEELASFLGPEHYVFQLTLSTSLIQRIKYPKTEQDKKVIALLPPEIVKAIKEGNKGIVLDRDKIEVFYYRKDDWVCWPRPMIYSLLKDIFMLEKMKMADMAALDGAISHIRLWRLGDLEKGIYPSPAGVARLTEMLLNNIGAGSIDLIWGPELDLVETKTDIHQFLGSTKYAPILDALYQGLGIPPTLAGGETGGGFTNNFISLRTLIERLKYGRDAVKRFWEKELRIFQQAMGFRYPGEVVFERMTLTDESAEKALLIQMADRNLISVETIQERFGEIPEIEMLRLKREHEMRKRGELPEKASQWHDPQPQHTYKKILLQAGDITASEVGLELEPRKTGETSRIDKQVKMKEKSTGIPGQGRPKNSNDKQKRKRKIVKPRSSAELAYSIVSIRGVQNQIADLLNPVFLKIKGKKNFRGLTEEEFNDIEMAKFTVLCNLPAETEVSDEMIKGVIQQQISIPHGVNRLYGDTLLQFERTKNRKPTTDEKREIQASIVALYHYEVEENVENSGL